MAKQRLSKKPKLKKFIDVCTLHKGRVGKIAEAFGVTRATVWNWCNTDPDFRSAIEDHRGQLLDECVQTARIVALGIPELDANKRVIGWKEKPDSFMLRYLMGTLGRREGFGENVDITSNGESIKPEPIKIEVIDSRDKVRVEDETSEDEAE